MVIDLDLRPKTSMISSRMSRSSSSITMSSQQMLRKYEVEKRIFQELAEMKRHQIRAGRANEAVMVKRIADQFNSNLDMLWGMRMFKGDYSFKTFENHLYSELDKVKEALRKIEGRPRSRSVYNNPEMDERMILPKIDNGRNHRKIYLNKPNL